MESAAVATPTASPSPTGGKEGLGILKGGGQDFVVFVYADTAEVSKGAFEFLGEMQQFLEMPETLSFEAIWITPELIETEHLIADLQQTLTPKEQTQTGKAETTKSSIPQKGFEKALPSQAGAKSSPSAPPQGRAEKSPVFSSVFSLARSMSKTAMANRSSPSPPKGEPTGHHSVIQSQVSHPAFEVSPKSHQDPYDREGDSRQQNQEKEQEQPPSKKKKIKIQNVKASKSKSTYNAKHPSQTQSSTPPSHTSIDDIYIRFMALMARILGQAEAEAHALYQRIKIRTDDVDTLTLLLSKINSAHGKIDWTNDEEMKALVQKARAIGVDIPEGKYSWTEEEQKLLKENIQMRKDSMEKITQLERTDMQRFLQEASQCHQARSNVLKLLKEVMDTIIANMRP